MARLKDEDQVRKALWRKLRREPVATIWEQLVEDGLVQDVIDDFAPTALADLVDEYRRFERYEARKRARAAEGRGEASRVQLQRGLQFAPLEELIAVEATREEGVVRFRQQVLGGRLLESDPETLEAGWFLEHVRGSRRLSGWLHAPNYATHGGEGVRPSLPETEAALAGYVAGTPQLSAHGRKDNELDFLLCLTECLMAWYGWPLAGEVERFVLCGETPHLLFMIASRREGERFAGRSGRITLEVNQAVSPAELSRFYKDLRKWLAANKRTPRRFRASGALATALALHVARSNDGRRWQEIMAAWNRQHPKDSFPDSRTFARRARDAYETLCGEALDYRGGKQGRDLLRTHNAPPPAAFTPLRADESPTS